MSIVAKSDRAVKALRRVSRRLPAIGVLLLASILVVVALLHRGIEVTELDVDDGGIWVSKGSDLSLGHLNYDALTFDGFVSTPSARVSLGQDGRTVTIGDETNHSVSSVDVTGMKLGGAITVPEGSQVAQGATTLAVLDASAGYLWVGDASRPDARKYDDTEAIADGLAGGVAPIVDQLTSAGSITPTIVVFATYYPDRSFATEDYEDDYALNRFFATTEIDTLIKTVESRYTTFARGDTSDESLRASRRHRAFGGFSMGATTTWDVFALRPQYFYGYIPMAGESWIGREEDADSAQIAQLVTAGAERAHYGPQDFRIFASVGSLDPALDDMSPQLAQLRADYPDLMTDDSLQMWIDEGESHSMASVGNQVAHDLPLLFPPA